MAFINPKSAADIAAEKQEKEKESRISEINARLLQIDSESVRPLRAKLSGTDTELDNDKLSALESEAENLRSELSALF